MFEAKVGAEVMCELARARGVTMHGVGEGVYQREAGHVERVDAESGTVFVRLIGLVHSPYEAGMYLALDAERVGPLGYAAVVS